MATTGHGATISFGTSGFTAQFTSIGSGSSERESIETTHLGTGRDSANNNVSYKTFQPSDLVDNGEKELEFYYDPDEAVPSVMITKAVETITMTYPIKPGASSGGAEVFDGFVTNYSRPTMVSGDLMTATCTVKVSGQVAYSAGS